jgi:hypothetical protein
MKATPQAKKMWEAVPKEVRVKLLNNVWCTRCRDMTGIVLEGMKVDHGDLVLEGKCVKCSGPVARLIEGD